MDLGRTLLNLASLHGTAFPGEDLRRHLGGDPAEPTPHFALHARRIGASIRHEGYHLTLRLSRADRPDRGRGHEVELYDLTADPECKTDLVIQEFERAPRTRATLVEWLTRDADLGLRGEGIADSRMGEQLEQLGYTGEDAGVDEADTWLWFEDGCGWCERFE